jgi:type VI secretion system lysozyme-like protein
MAESRNTGGARALLFERLVDNDLWRTEESPPFRVLTRRGLSDSLIRELGQLLNSRCPVPLHLIGQEERTVINYGLPDFTALSPHSPDDRKLIAEIIGQTITAFETRLRNVRVTAEYFQGEDRTLHITVEADLVTDTVIEIRSFPEFGTSVEPVSFPLVLNSKTGIVDIYENER